MNRTDLAMQVMVKLGEAAAAVAHAHSLLAVLAVTDQSLNNPKMPRGGSMAPDNMLYPSRVNSIASEIGRCAHAAQDYVVEGVREARNS